MYDLTSRIEIEDTAVEVNNNEYRADYVEVVSERPIIHGGHNAIYGDPEWHGKIEWADGVDFDAPRNDDGIPTLQEVRIKTHEARELHLQKVLFESDTKFIATA